MEQFASRGFEKTTMREIARSSGMSLGAAYHYVPSKEFLAHDFYKMTFQDHLPEVERVLREEKTLPRRLAGVIAANLKVAEPFHEIGKMLYRVAADPGHPLSPFSEASRDLRARNIDIMRRVLETEKVPEAFRESLPELFWMLKMACVLYWVHDASPDREKSYALTARLSDLTAAMVKLARIPILRDPVKTFIAIFQAFKIYA